MKNLFKQIVNWVKSILGNLLDQFKVSSKVAVEIVGKIKTIVESEVFDIAVDLIPGNLDNIILNKVRGILPLVIKNLSLVHGIVDESETNSDAIEKFIIHLKSLNPDARKGVWITLAAEINVALSDGKLSFAESVILTQLIYSELFKKKK